MSAVRRTVVVMTADEGNPTTDGTEVDQQDGGPGSHNEGASGGSHNDSGSGGTSDARFLKDACPVCEFGMVGESAHKVDESIELADLAALTDIYAGVLSRFFRNAA